MSSLKRPRPIDDLLRMALWEAHGHKCAYDYDGPKIEKLGDMEVDHILPQFLWNGDPHLPDILKTLALLPDYHPDSLDNLVPARRGRNRQKGVWIFSESSARFYRELAAKQQDKVEQLCCQYEDERRQERIRAEAQAACAADPAMRAKLLEALATTPPFPEEECCDNHSFRFSRSRVMLHCHLPQDDRDGSMLIRINSLYLHAVSFTFETPEILSRLLRGWNTGPTLGQRGFVLGRAEDRPDEWIVTLGGATIFLTTEELGQLAEGLDRLAPKFLAALRQREVTAGTFGFEPDGTRNVRLLTIKRALWREILLFAREHDYDKGNSAWHIFDAGGFGHIKIVRRTAEGHIIPFEAYVYPASPETVLHGPLIEPEDDVCLCWDASQSRLYQHPDEAKPMGWSAAETFQWLTDKLIPEVVHRFDKPSMLDRFRQYAGLKEAPRYFSETYGVNPALLSLPYFWSGLSKFTDAAQALYIEHSHEPVPRAVVENALTGLVLLADALPIPADQLGYIAVKLGVPGVDELPQVVDSGRRQMLAQAAFTGSDVDHVLRCAIAIFHVSTPADSARPELFQKVVSAWQPLAAAAQSEAVRYRTLERLQHPGSQ